MRIAGQVVAAPARVWGRGNDDRGLTAGSGGHAGSDGLSCRDAGGDVASGRYGEAAAAPENVAEAGLALAIVQGIQRLALNERRRMRRESQR